MSSKIQELHQWLLKCSADLPAELDLCRADQLNRLQALADELIMRAPQLVNLDALEHVLFRSTDSLIFVKTALKLARSKLIIRAIEHPMKISVVFAMYKEHNRIRSVEEHPHGEDFLRRKVDQLNWLCTANPNVKWELVPVDDGCPEQSGQIAQTIVRQENFDDRVHVHFLEEGIQNNATPVKKLQSTAESQKGGAIIYGMWQAAKSSSIAHHIIVYTDADLSTHLGQIGLLVDPIVNQNKSVAIGSRRETDSVVVKKGSRNTRGKLFIYLWKRMLPDLWYIIDTQCGFKAFRAEVLMNIVNDLIEFKFAFDIELLLKAERAAPDSIAKVGVAWIDSEAASTTTAIQPYLPMLKKIASMYRLYLPANQTADSFAAFVEEMNGPEFNNLLSNIPAEIAEEDPSRFSSYAGLTAADLRRKRNE